MSKNKTPKNIWRITRTIFAILFFISLTFIFIEIDSEDSIDAYAPLLFLQFVPSLISFIGFASIAAAGFIVVAMATMLYGRVYCSFVCPLGILQDIFTRIANIAGIKQRFRFKKEKPILRYSILAVTIASAFAGTIFLINILDPYSNFGRIAAGIIRPIYVYANNAIAFALHKVSVYGLNRIHYTANLTAILYPAAVFAILAYLAAKHGRLFCNSICPVGTLLGLLSKVSIFKISIDKSACTSCGNCMQACKSECIDLKTKTIDHSRCVACMNCIDSCTEKGIGYTPRFSMPAAKHDPSRRKFASSLVAASALVAASCTATKKTNSKTNAITPPGSKSAEHFNSKCTACQLCVNACPSGVLQASFMEYGLSGFMQPRLDFNAHFCNYECNVCSNVCPTGAIEPITVDQKKQTQIGKVTFYKQLCVVETEGTACGACSEHCPTQAVHMVPYKNGLTIPEISPDICVGCGACEYICPVRPNKAIVVIANNVHQKAMKPHTGGNAKEEVLEEFPF